MSTARRSTDDARPGDGPIQQVTTPDDVEVLRRLVEGTVRATGERFFQSLVEHLAGATNARHAFIAEFTESRTRVRSVAIWMDGRITDNIEWDLGGTPCRDVVEGRVCHYPSGVARLFPDDEPFVRMGIESYLGVPLSDSTGGTLGHMAVFDERPMPPEPRRLGIFQLFAQRAAAELERLRMERMLRASEQVFRDLFEEAPIPYVYEDTDTRFVSANRAFMDLLGLQKGDVPGTYGLSLVAPTPETQERVHQSLASEQAGRERGFIEIELRRKDNGQSVWVQRWSRPEPDGRHTRTMLIDITARVLAERERNRLQQQNQYLREEIKSEYNFEEIIGRSASLHEALSKVKQVAGVDATVLITGETGTGKELIARAIHNRSKRRDRPLIKLNCAALPTGLIESELFGHEKGAFTGALERRVGRFALADGGTIFLDEIGDIPMDVQVRLLRVLQEQEFEAVGATRTTRVDVRVIAATNRNLEQAVADGEFRADLYYRLNVVPIRLPPLRERGDDIPLLAHYFAEKYAAKAGRDLRAIDPDSMRRLQAYAWPGNIRELENIIERAVILSTGPALHIDERTLPVSGDARGAPPRVVPAAASPDDSLTAAESEKRLILSTLERTRWVIDGPSGAARLLGLHPNTLRSRMKKHGLSRRHGRS
jgi:formate hydrogenlyase transcriptional activator